MGRVGSAGPRFVPASPGRPVARAGAPPEALLPEVAFLGARPAERRSLRRPPAPSRSCPGGVLLGAAIPRSCPPPEALPSEPCSPRPGLPRPPAPLGPALPRCRLPPALPLSEAPPLTAGCSNPGRAGRPSGHSRLHRCLSPLAGRSVRSLCVGGPSIRRRPGGGYSLRRPRRDGTLLDGVRRTAPPGELGLAGRVLPPRYPRRRLRLPFLGRRPGLSEICSAKDALPGFEPGSSSFQVGPLTTKTNPWLCALSCGCYLSKRGSMRPRRRPPRGAL